MIIECINCNKKFNVSSELIPDSGREIQCGSCNHVWFYEKEKKITEPLNLYEHINIEKNKPNIVNNENDKNLEKPVKKGNTQTNKKTYNNKGSKFFSYLIVSIISFVALVILLETLKTPLINIFPELEIILFNLFETLKDIKLFIVDLS
jgi:predicted Zn finger-like uncharacterized protein